MPHYFFHLEDGRLVQDRSGTELPDYHAASAEAVRVLAQGADEKPSDVVLDGQLKVTVTDDQGLTLFVAEMSVLISDGAPGQDRSRSSANG